MRRQTMGDERRPEHLRRPSILMALIQGLEDKAKEKKAGTV